MRRFAAKEKPHVFRQFLRCVDNAERTSQTARNFCDCGSINGRNAEEATLRRRKWTCGDSSVLQFVAVPVLPSVSENVTVTDAAALRDLSGVPGARGVRYMQEMREMRVTRGLREMREVPGRVGR